MKIFLDTADISAIKDLASSGLIDGVTTNPSLIAKSGKEQTSVISQICEIIEGPVSAEVISTTRDEMLAEGKKLASIAKNVCIKLPTTLDGLKVSAELTKSGFLVNMTLCFSSPQAMLVAKTGATFVSPFIGRWDDIAINGMQIVHDIKTLYQNYNFQTQILGASIRHINHVIECMNIGVDVATIPPSLFEKLYSHPLTNQGLEIFLNDYKKSLAS